jgi:hypothetical protein
MSNNVNIQGDPHVILTSREFDDMQERLRWLDALEAAGVDNWEGYSHAREILGEEDED